MDASYAQKQTFLCISITHADFSIFSDLFTEAADEPAAEKPADEKKGGSNDRGKYLLFPFFPCTVSA
jgi:hypothetical protein